jgi:putative tryptophan/tyrosine transport system substrate-binding protein
MKTGMRREAKPVKVASRQWSVVSRSVFTLALYAWLFTLCVKAEAQQQSKIYKIGELTARPGLRRPSEEFLRALRDLGYVEGKNIAFDVRSAEGKPERFPALADELVRLKVDVLVASSNAEARAFKDATKTIPIVFYTGGNPVEVGLVDSLARPGRNITGVTLISTELVGKRLELLKETIPTLSHVAVLWNPSSRIISGWKESLLPARELGLQLHSMEVSSTNKFDTAFKEATKAGSRAIAVQLHPLFASNQNQIINLATKNRLPAIYPRRDFVSSGGLMSYGADRDEPFRRVAVLVDKILKGAKPADLPVEQPTKFELVINLKAAKQISVMIPPNVLARADRVIR